MNKKRIEEQIEKLVGMKEAFMLPRVRLDYLGNQVMKIVLDMDRSTKDMKRDATDDGFRDYIDFKQRLLSIARELEAASKREAERARKYG